MAHDHTHFGVRILVKSILNILVVAGMVAYLPEYFVLTGGVTAIIAVGILLTVLNLIVRPILNILTLPLKLFATILAVIVVNGVFVQLIYELTRVLDPALIAFSVEGGVIGWVAVATVFGFANWLIKAMMK